MNKQQATATKEIIAKLKPVINSLNIGLSFTQKSDLQSRLNAIQEEINHYGMTYGYDSMHEELQKTLHNAFVALEPAIAECI